MSRLLSFLLRLLIIGMGLVFGLFVLLAGLVLAVGVVIWSMLRGRKPKVMRFRMNPGSPFGGMASRTAPQGDVVDIEAREIPEAMRNLPRDRH